jgi:hypothetical protein
MHTTADEFFTIDKQFEDVHVYCHKATVTLIEEVSYLPDAMKPGGAGLWEALSVSRTTKERNLIGKILMIFQNQGENKNLAIFLNGDFILSAPFTVMPADTITKAVQYLFEWINEYVKEVNIRDENNNLFIVPAFHFSRDYFEQKYPD